MRTLLTIYAMRLRAVRNNLLRRGWRNGLGWLVVLIALGAVDVSIFSYAPQSIQLVGGTMAGVHSGRLDMNALFSLLVPFFNGSFAMLFLASFPLTIGTYTYKSDFSILLPTPVQPRVIFAEKLLTGMLRQYVIVFPIMGPYLLGLGAGFHLSAGYYAFSLLVLLLAPIAPTCVGAILTFVFLTLFPPARAKTFVTVGGAIVGSAFYLSQEIIWSGHNTVNIGSASAGIVRGINHQWLSQLPPSWPASGLTLAADGHFLVALGYGVLFALLGGICFAFAVSTALKTFSSGWANFQESARLRQPLMLGGATPPVRMLRRPIFGLSPLLPKEWLVFARDPQQWAALIMPLGVTVYFSYVLIFKYGSAGLLSGLRFMLAVSGTNVLISSVTAPLSLTILNREQRTFILLRTWPVSAAVVLRDKFLSVYMPLLVAFEALVVLITIGDHLPVQLALLAAVGAALTSGTLIGWNMLLSLLFPRLDWTNITQMVTWQAWLLSFVGGIGLGSLDAVFLAGGPLASTSPAPLSNYAGVLTAVGFALVCAIAGTVAVLLFVWGPRRMAAIEIR